MDFGGLIRTDGSVSTRSFHGGDVFSSSPASTGSNLKQGRSAGPEKHDWRCLKMAKTEALPLLPEGEQLVSFSAAKPEITLLSTNRRLPGLNLGRLDANSNQLSVGGRGTFTPSQWMELENQALIYNYIDANAAIPANLLISMRRSFNPFGYSAFSTEYFRTSALRQGLFQVGLRGNDPEPGRCRRTDGKKWRCSRDAVADQKYCERHLNRGRHRSRKPVEGRIGKATNMMPAITTSSAARASFSSRSSNSSAVAQQQMSNMHPITTSSVTIQLNRMIASKEQASTCSKDTEELCELTLINSKAADITSLPNPRQNQIDEFSSNMAFGFIPTGSSSLPSTRNATTLRQFTWPEREGMQSDYSYDLSTPMPMTSDYLPCSTGGPLAEALKNTGMALDHGKKPCLDLMMDDWDMSPWTGSSSSSTVL